MCNVAEVFNGFRVKFSSNELNELNSTSERGLTLAIAWFRLHVTQIKRDYKIKGVLFIVLSIFVVSQLFSIV
jgi:hypothetical protein